jgi:NAD(P)-dependent dehydrogenase (short-subunit alcohol dehydrogenase family)
MSGHMRGRTLGLLGLCALLVGVPAMADTSSWFGLQSDALRGQTALVTGSTDGMGRELALELAGLGATVIVHGRNRERGEAVVQEIRENGGEAVFYQADFASIEALHALATKVRREHERLDLLINNAGLFRQAGAEERRLSDDGHELMFAVNYLAGFVLTHELRSMLAASSPARVVNVSSVAQQAIDFDDVMLAQAFTQSRAYAQSKLAQILFTFDIAADYARDGITVNAVHPATLMDTTMVREAGMAPRAQVKEGVEAVMQLAVSPAVEGRTGLYFQGLQETRAHDQAYDAQAREQLRELSEALAAR